MSLDTETRSRIAGLIEANPVMLFMKGTPDAPGCGFSAQVVSILSQLIPDYGAFDVLGDAEVRSGIKEYSDWPTIPQLYVRGEFMGGCDIVKEMYATGELHQTLGVPVPEVSIPTITITDAAAELIRNAQAQSEHPALHILIDPSFQHQLGFGPAQTGELEVETAGLKLLLDRDSASRADGLVIDLADADGESGLTVNNPNAPGGVPRDAIGQIGPQEVKAMLERGHDFLLLDVRTPDEHQTASIPGARLVDDQVVAEVAMLPKDTMLVFHCHHGGRSQAAAEHFAAQGFSNCHNLAGGIDAWSLEVDSNVPRY